MSNDYGVRDPELVQIHAEAGRFYQACLRGSWVPGYLASRRIDAALLPSSPWKIGYALANWTALTDHLRRLGHCDAALLCSGLVVSGRDGQLRDHFHDRLMIPIRAADGVCVAFIGRRHPEGDDELGPKYLNSPEAELYRKGHLLAGLAEARGAFRNGAQPVLVEGPLDAIAVSIATCGALAGVSPCGTALTAEQVAVLAQTVDIRECGIRVAMDGDSAGRAAAIRAYHHLAPLHGSPLAVVFADGMDPAGVLREHGPDALALLLHEDQPLADIVVDAQIEEWSRGAELQFAEQQIGALRSAAKTVATLTPDDVGRQALRLTRLFTERYGWKHDEVTRELTDAIDRHYGYAQVAGQSLPVSELLSRSHAAFPPANKVPTQQPRPRSSSPEASRPTAERN